MGDISPFASAFGAVDATSPFGSPPESPPRVVGFAANRSASGTPLTLMCSVAERRSSMGGLNQLMRVASLQQEPQQAPRPLLTITTTRSLRIGVPKGVRRPPRIAEDAAEPGGHGGDSAAVLGTTAPSHGPLKGLRRAASGHIDVPSRLSKAQTAPDGLPDSLVLAAITAGYGPSPSRGHSPFEPAVPGAHAPAGAAGGAPFLPAQQATVDLRPSLSGSNDSSTCSTGGAASSGRPPMPVTPAFAAARSGSGSGQQQRAAAPAQRQGSSYRDLFDAQAETAMAQAQVCGLQEALRRKGDELGQVQQELRRISAERDAYRDSAAALASNASSAFVAATDGGSGHGYGPGMPAVPGAPAPAAAAPTSAPLKLSRLRSAGPAFQRGRGAAAVQGGLARAQLQAAMPPPEVQQQALNGQPAEELPQSAMVSAFASHALPFSFE